VQPNADQLGDKLLELNGQFKERSQTSSECSSAESTRAVSSDHIDCVVEGAVSVSSAAAKDDSDYVNPRGVRFVQDGPNGNFLAAVLWARVLVGEMSGENFDEIMGIKGPLVPLCNFVIGTKCSEFTYL
jgi:hypothetical protein